MNHRRDLMNESNEFQQRYLNGGDQINQGNNRHGYTNLKHQAYSYEIQQINHKLDAICNEKMGDLTNPSPHEIQKTIQVIQVLISEINKLRENRQKLSTQIRHLSNVQLQSAQAKDKFYQDKKNLETQKQTLIHKYKTLQASHRQFTSKIQSQKEDLLKQVKQLQARERTFEAEFKKKDNQIKSLQDSIKKFQERHQFKNSFDVVQKFENGPAIYATNAEHEYSRLASSSIDETFKKLRSENQYLKDCLVNIYKQLNSVLELKKQTLRNKRGYDGEYQSYFQLNCFRPETLNLPEQWNRQRLKQLNQNINKFKEAIKIGDLSEGKIEERKNNCIGGIKQLISNYKQVVDTQDQLLNKVLLKSKQFRASEMSHLENRCSKLMDQNQIERAKKFVQEQGRYLEQKNADLEKTRRLMQVAMKKAQENKRQMLRQRQDFENQALEMRKSIEVLPAMIEEEMKRRQHN